MKNFLILSLIALASFLPIYKAHSGILINDRFGSVDVGTTLRPKNDDRSKYSEFDSCEIKGIKINFLIIECSKPTREPKTGNPFSFKKTFEISAHDIPRYFTK